jgi:hypothetical protein
MPGTPKVGQVFRTENIPGQVFEEVTVKATDKTVPGPIGKVSGAMVGEELHDDAQTSDKVFAPGYGEFLTKDSDGVEAMAVAAPTDAASGPMPTALQALLSEVDAAYRASMSGNWSGASVAARATTAAGRRYLNSGDAPLRLEPPAKRALAKLSRAVAAHDRPESTNAAIDVARVALDLELRYTRPAEIDRARFALWARQIVVDAKSHDLGGVRGDLATMELVRDRFADGLDCVARSRINASLLALRDSVQNKDLRGASSEATELRGVTAKL